MANAFQRKVFNILQFSKLQRCTLLKNTLYRNFSSSSTKYSKLNDFKVGRLFAFVGAFMSGVGTIYYLKVEKSVNMKRSFLLSAASEDDKVVEAHTELSLKQIMFEEFASYEFNGKAIMSPKDFLDSLVDNRKRKEGSNKVNRKVLSIQDVNSILKSNQNLPKNKESLFSNLGNNGIITYPEYLFLLTLLTKSSHGLHVAFRMLDLDGNETLGKTEFQQLEKMLNKKTSGKSLTKSSKPLKSKELPSTSLLIHFFGKSGDGQLTFTDMLQFTRNLQREFWTREFLQHSKSENVIDGAHFGQLLLQCTQLDDKDIKEYIERLKSRQGNEINVTLNDYIKFGEFLNSLGEFATSLKIYNVANQPVTQEEFKRAARISTGEVLDDRIVNTIFLMFDNDGDGKLSQKEFLGLMKDRVSKRFTNGDGSAGALNKFLRCVKEEVVN